MPFNSMQFVKKNASLWLQSKLNIAVCRKAYVLCPQKLSQKFFDYDIRSC